MLLIDGCDLLTECSPDCQRCTADLQTGVGSVCLWCKEPSGGALLLGDHCVPRCPRDHYGRHGACIRKDWQWRVIANTGFPSEKKSDLFVRRNAVRSSFFSQKNRWAKRNQIFFSENATFSDLRKM